MTPTLDSFMRPSLIPADIPMSYSPKEFRVWDTLLEKFIPWNSVISLNDPTMVVQQKTGIKDRLGNNLYEGDIVKLEWNDGLNFAKVARVVFCYGSWRLMYKLDTQIPAWYSDFRDAGLIGNIFETPNLLL